jgi:hypothetical protein
LLEQRLRNMLRRKTRHAHATAVALACLGFAFAVGAAEISPPNKNDPDKSVSDESAGVQAPSNPQGYCVNRGADFYPYAGEPCKSGYQLGSVIAEELTGAWLPCQESSAFQWTAQSSYPSKAEYLRYPFVRSKLQIRRSDRQSSAAPTPPGTPPWPRFRLSATPSLGPCASARDSPRVYGAHHARRSAA